MINWINFGNNFDPSINPSGTYVILYQEPQLHVLMILHTFL